MTSSLSITSTFLRFFHWMVFDLFFLLCDRENDPLIVYFIELKEVPIKKKPPFLMRTCQSRVKSCTVGMCNAILGDDLKVARIIWHERKRWIHSVQRFIGSFDIDDDMAWVHLTTPEMLAPGSRLADLATLSFLSN